MSIFEEFNSGFVKDLNSFCSNRCLCETRSLDPASPSPVCLPLAHDAVSVPGLCPLVRAIPLWQRPALPDVDPPSFGVWHEDRQTEAPSGYAVLQPGCASSRVSRSGEYCWKKQLQVRKCSHPLHMKGTGTTTHHGRDLVPSDDLMPEVLRIGHQAVKRSVRKFDVSH